jgi:hypothetical protein
MMLSPEIYAILGGGAIFPYAAEAIWHWLRRGRGHQDRPNALE